jgi:undecaprenyl-phosphate 4-deoxy-4-formamido-L-arabinose transferase
MTASRPFVSILVPVFNGARILPDLHREIAAVLDTLAGGSEVIYVDDGSKDDSLKVLRALQDGDRRIRIIELATNFGQHAAFSAAFANARGRCLVTMDADLQCDPRDIPKLLAPLSQGYDLVSGIRVGRQDPRLRRVLSRFVTSLVARMSGVKLRDIGCPFNACSAEIGQQVAAFGELRRFLKPLVVSLAKRVAEVEVAHRPRAAQQPRSSYSSTALLRLFMDFFVGSLGDAFAWIFVVAAAVAAVLTVTTGAAAVAALLGRVSLPVVLGPAVVAVGAWLIAVLGLAGDYLQRIHRQSSGRPFYLVRRVHESPNEAVPDLEVEPDAFGPTPQRGRRALGDLASGG